MTLALPHYPNHNELKAINLLIEWNRWSNVIVSEVIFLAEVESYIHMNTLDLWLEQYTALQNNASS